ncbi:MAG: M17 family peptidase N-terminal domain-containing protein, partial [Planctomycetota bacterium]
MLEALPFPNPKIESLRQLPSDPETTVVAGLHEDQPLGPTLQAIDDAGNGWLTALIDRGQVNGKSGSSYQLVIPADSGKVGGLLFLMGLGRPDRLNRTAALNASATAMRALNKQAHENIVIALAECFDDGVADALIAGVLTGVEGQAIYQNDPGTFVPERIQVLDVSPSDVQRGQSIGQAINHTRRLVNEPAAMIYPQSFCDRARD